MGTQGIDIHSGYLVHRGMHDVPDAFWARIKHEASKKQLSDELQADMTWSLEPKGAIRTRAEHSALRWWVRRLVGEPPVWPWEAGWTHELVDSWPRATP